MAMLDRAIEMLGNNHLPMMDSRTRMLQAALALLADNGQTGGLRGLAERFQEAGLGNIIASWIGKGENIPAKTDQIQQVLGEGHLQQIAEETGLTETETAEHLSRMLPDLVDQMTSAGHIPEAGLGNTSDLLDQFLGRYR